MQRIEYGLALRSLASKNLMRKAPETVVGLVHSQPEDYIKYPRKGPRQTSEKKMGESHLNFERSVNSANAFSCASRNHLFEEV